MARINSMNITVLSILTVRYFIPVPVSVLTDYYCYYSSIRTIPVPVTGYQVLLKLPDSTILVTVP